MTKTAILIIMSILLLLLAGGGYFIFNNIKGQRPTNDAPQNLPDINAWNVDSTLIQYTPPKPNQPTMILYFNSECSICQYEAKAIYNDSISLSAVNILMISSESLSTIQSFASAYRLDQRENIHMAQMDPVAVTQTFGEISVPNILIYNTQEQLVKHFRLQRKTKMKVITKYLSPDLNRIQ